MKPWIFFILLFISILAPVASVDGAQVTTEKTSKKDQPVSLSNKKKSKVSDLFEQKKFSQLTESYSTNLDQLNADELTLLAIAYGEIKDYKQMLKIIDLVVGQRPEEPEALNIKAMALMKLNKEREAMDLIKHALEINPRYEPAYHTAAEYYDKKSNRYELKLLYQDMIKNIGERSEYVSQLCQIATLDGQHDQAIYNCNRGVSLDPSRESNYVYLGIVYKDQEKWKSAEGYLKRATIKFPDSEFTNYSYANYLFERKNFIEANKYFEKAIRADVNSARALIGLGLTSIEVNKPARGYEAFKKACTLKQKEVVSSIRIALQALRKSKDQEMIQKFETLSDHCL